METKICDIDKHDPNLFDMGLPLSVSHHIETNVADHDKRYLEISLGIDQNFLFFQGPGVYRKAPGSFLFSLVNQSGLPPTKLPLIAGKEDNAILCNSGYGPIFGGGPDFRIPHAPNSSNCFVSLNNTYQCPTGQNNANFFTGAQNFTIAEMEVFVFEK